LASDQAIVKAIVAVDRMFDEDERLVYKLRMQSLADVESKIASAEENKSFVIPAGTAGNQATGMYRSIAFSVV